jgi:hypothetical protein
MASTTLTRTPSSAGNQKTWTLSAWVKNSYGGMFFCVDSHGATKSIQCDLYQGAAYLEIAQYASGSGAWSLKTNRLFRDRNAWYHIVLSVDTTQATSSNRVKIYINGVRETSFSTETYPSQNYDTGANSAVTHMIGNRPSSSAYFNGLMTHFHFIDGTAYDASAFGETDATTGIWKPKLNPSVTYGTNGFFLKFNEGALGTDSSPNGNNLTVNGSLTPTKDTPDNVFATLNPLDNPNQKGNYSTGNLTIDATSSLLGDAGTRATLGFSQGKWYWEAKVVTVAGTGNNNNFIGIQDAGSAGQTGSTNAYAFNLNDGALAHNGSAVTSGLTTYSSGNIIGVGYDADNGDLYLWTNGVAENSGNAVATGIDTTKTWQPYICCHYGANSAKWEANFGNGYFGTTPVASAGLNGNGAIFEYDCPSGYYALNTKNINTYG